jgi:hypothetical protein
LLDTIPERSLILVSNHVLQPFYFDKYPGIKKFSIDSLQTFEGGLVQSENYTVYRISK